MVVGLPFFLAGAVSLAVGVREVSGGDQGAWVVVLIGAVFSVVGAVLLLGRKGIELDLKARTYRQWWGLLVPWRVKGGSLDEIDRITLTLEVRTSKHGKYRVYPVRLTGPGKVRLSFAEPRAYEAGRRLAVELASELHLPLEDWSSGQEVVRDPDHLDESLRDRVHREGKPPRDVGSPPALLRSRIETEGMTIRFCIPPSGLKARHFISLVPLAVIQSIVFLVLFLPALDNAGRWGGDLPEIIYFAILACLVFVLPLLIFGVRTLARARTGWVVEASPQALRVERRTPFSTRKSEIPSGAIQDLEVSRAIPEKRNHQSVLEPFAARAIVARGDGRTVSFGGHLGDEEKQWIRDVLEQVLTA